MTTTTKTGRASYSIDVIQQDGECIGDTIARGRRDHPNAMRFVIPTKSGAQRRARPMRQAA